MREAILMYAPAIIWVLTIAELGFGIIAIAKERKILNVLAALVCCGLVIDALIQAFGVAIGEGMLLQGISQIRYILHGILVPLLVPIAFYSYGIKRDWAKKTVWIVTAAIILCGIFMGFMTRTEPVLFAGILRYAQSDETPAFARKVNTILSIGGVIPLIVVGIAHLVKHRRPWIMLSGIAMFAFSALAPATGNMDLNFVLTMVGEALMVMFFTAELVFVKEE